MRRKEQDFSERIGEKAERKRYARRTRDERIWYGLGLFGLVGWSVAVPTLLGLALGVWIDTRWPGPISWTLTLMIAGLLLGCLNAWFWVQQERREIIRRRMHPEDDDEAD